MLLGLFCRFNILTTSVSSFSDCSKYRTFVSFAVLFLNLKAESYCVFVVLSLVELFVIPFILLANHVFFSFLLQFCISLTSPIKCFDLVLRFCLTLLFSS